MISSLPITAKDFSNVPCTVCGCLCDDLRITVDQDRIVRAEGACHLSAPWFLAQNTLQPPIARIGEQEATLDAALDHAAQLLHAARSPLIYGLSRSSTDGQRAAVALAERLGATIDTPPGLSQDTLRAMQEVGLSTCSLGEVKNRADLVIFWGCDPLVSHPRLCERVLDVAGQFTPRGRADRTVIVVNAQANATSQRADLFVPVEAGQDWEMLEILRGLLRGLTPANGSIREADLTRLTDLVQRMRTCHYGIIFFGTDLDRTSAAPRTIAALLQLVIDLNDCTRFYARALGGVGTDNVLAWQTGYAFGVNWARGYPRYNPGEFTASDMLARGEVDACLVVHSEDVAHLSERAREALHRMPLILLDPPIAPSALPAAVRFTTAVPGVHEGGTAYRMDDVSIPLQTLLPTPYPSEEVLLSALVNRLQG